MEKKSKLRNFFEKSKICDVIPCYKDNEQSIKKLIIKNLKDFKGVTPEVINILIANSGLDRIKINNELIKINSFFIEKNIRIDQLEKLLDQNINDDFTLIKDNALKGNNTETNKLLSNTIFESEKIPLYLNIVNQRLNKLKEILTISKNNNFADAVETLKPPIFWKDKNNFIQQAKTWNEYKISKALSKTYALELNFKSNSFINKELLIKKLILDICILAST